MSSQNVSTDVLRTLHRIHRQLADLKGRLQRGPKQISAAEASVSFREEQLAQARADARAARLAADRKQLQLKAGEEKIEELKPKLNMAASNREYQALKDQMAAQEMTNSVLTDEILEGLEKIDEIQEKAGQAEEVLAKTGQKAQKVRSEVEQQEPLIQGDLTRLEDELKECEAGLPWDIRELYRRLVRQRSEDALAAVEDQCCSGCHQHVPLNVCAEIMLSHPMVCKTCGRLLYMPEGHLPGK
ncbi:MAG: zinc ribbon domain-containing protein [Planctomycetota bacterium]|jgi:predicted  nucleic acid-binding Zn-ribbon protein